MAETFGQRLEGLVLGGLARGVKGSQGPAVERPVGAQHHVTAMASPLPRELDGALVGLSPAVGEEYPPAAADQPVEGRGHLPAGHGPEEVGGVEQCPRRVAHSVGDDGMGVAERRHRKAGEKIDVTASLVVPQVRPLARTKVTRGVAYVDIKRVAWISAGDVCGHAVTIVPIPLRVKISSRSGVGRPPVEDVRLRDSPADGVQRGLGLGDHAGADGALVRSARRSSSGAQLAEQAGRVARGRP